MKKTSISLSDEIYAVLPRGFNLSEFIRQSILKRFAPHLTTAANSADLVGGRAHRSKDDQGLRTKPKAPGEPPRAAVER